MRIITQEDIEGRALTPEEKGWLEQRDRHAEVERNEELFDGEEEDDEGLESEADNYAAWKNKELLEEGARREPPVDFSGATKKSEYIAALRAWDVEHPEE